MAETATIIGYKKSLVTFNVIPNVAMMNENSPICDKLIPVCIDCFRGCPENSAPIVDKNDCPRITAKVKIPTGTAYFTSISGLINIPTDTKKTAPNKSLTGLTKCSICSA